MTSRRILLAVFAVAPMLFGTAADAAEMPYTPAAFEAAQKPILLKFEADPKFKDLQVFDVDFDSRKDVVKRFGATMQSTLITYKGEKETGRSAGETKPEVIASLLDKAI